MPRNERGFTIVETMVAAIVMAMLLTAGNRMYHLMEKRAAVKRARSASREGIELLLTDVQQKFRGRATFTLVPSSVFDPATGCNDITVEWRNSRAEPKLTRYFTACVPYAPRPGLPHALVPMPLSGVTCPSGEVPTLQVDGATRAGTVEAARSAIATALCFQQTPACPLCDITVQVGSTFFNGRGAGSVVTGTYLSPSNRATNVQYFSH